MISLRLDRFSVVKSFFPCFSPSTINKYIIWHFQRLVLEVYGARATIIDNIASDIRPLDFRAPQAAKFETAEWRRYTPLPHNVGPPS
jgi:hypothetical protein